MELGADIRSQRGCDAARLPAELGPGRQIEAIRGLKPVVPLSVAPNIFINRDAARTDDLEAVLLNQEGRVVVNAYAEKVRVGIDDIDEFRVPHCRGEMRVDRDVAEKPEPCRLTRCYQEGLFPPAPHPDNTLY